MIIVSGQAIKPVEDAVKSGRISVSGILILWWLVPDTEDFFYSHGQRTSVYGTGDLMEPVKIPRMPKTEYDSLIKRQYVSRIAFGACEHPYIAPFMYVFDGKYLYFLSTKYGRKMEYFKSNPKVSVEIEEYTPDLSAFTFVSLQGFLEEVKEPSQKKKVREQFVGMIKNKGLSPHVLSAFGHSPADPPETIVTQERSMVWKLVGVKDIVALKNG